MIDLGRVSDLVTFFFEVSRVDATILRVLRIDIIVMDMLILGIFVVTSEDLAIGLFIRVTSSVASFVNARVLQTS